MKKLILLTSIFLFGCASPSVPVVQKFPDATPELMKKCEELMTVEGDKVAITEVLKTVIHNYSMYYQCSTKVEGWQEWYNKQKKLYEEIKP